MSISIITTTFNAERYIERYCKHHQWADEIIITDSKSTDNTVKIAKRFPNVKVISKECLYSEGFDTSDRSAIHTRAQDT